MKTLTRSVGLVAALTLGALAACGDDAPSDTTSTGTGAAGPGSSTSATSTSSGGGAGGAGGGGGSGGAPDCVMNPTTHEEIINACTDAEKVAKEPVLPLLNPDGSLPPLP
jgi:hypothetical protein